MNNEAAYIFVASGFIIVLNLMAFISLRVNYKSTRKPYLLIASIAITIEALRQIPAFLLSFDPESFLGVLLTFLLQFFASWMLLWAVMRKESELNADHKTLLGILLAFFVTGMAFTAINGFPETTLYWLPLTLPSILTVIAVVWKIRRTAISALSGKVLLMLSGIALVTIRISINIVDAIEMIYLLFYLDVLIFPILVSALALAEVEDAHSQVSDLLKERTRSEADVRFIIDNSLDIILTVSGAGLLRSWNKRAENVFGYKSAQTVGKMYIDELFSGSFWHKNADQEEGFTATMERIDGKSIPVNARIKTVVDGLETYTIYVISEGAVEL